MTLERQVRVPTGGQIALEATLTMPKRSRGLAVFAVASRSGALAQASRAVARGLHQESIATLELDLLTPQEAHPASRNQLDCLEADALVQRLADVTHRALYDRDTRHLTVGYLGIGIGVSVALIAAARHPRSIGALVGVGGLAELARDVLPRVRAPTLLVLGGEDAPAVDLAREALRLLPAEKQLEIVPRATRLFEQPAAMKRVADLAAGWFVSHLGPAEHVWEEDVGGWLS